MTFQLLLGDGAALLGSTSARIAADQREAFADAHALLARAAEAAAGAEAEVEAARDEGREQGRREAIGLAEAEIAARIGELAARLADEAARRRAEVAEAAYAGARAILGAIDRNDAAVALALNAVAKAPADERLVVACSPAIADRLRATIGRADVAVEPRGDLGPLEVEVLTGAGRMVAGMDVQLAGLAERWGVTP